MDEDLDAMTRERLIAEARKLRALWGLLPERTDPVRTVATGPETALANALTGLVALSHIGFLILEMFFWDHPVGRRIFGMTPEVSASSAVLAANQGLYNGFLAAGLLWALGAGRRDLKLFFLGCVIVAGIFGGSRRRAR